MSGSGSERAFQPKIIPKSGWKQKNVNVEIEVDFSEAIEKYENELEEKAEAIKKLQNLLMENMEEIGALEEKIDSY